MDNFALFFSSKNDKSDSEYLAATDKHLSVVPFPKPQMKAPLTTLKLPEKVTGVRSLDLESWTVPVEIGKGVHWMDGCSRYGIKCSSCSTLHLKASSYIDYDNKMIPIPTSSISQQPFSNCISRNNSSSVIHRAGGSYIPNSGNDVSLIYNENKNHDILSPTKSDSSKVIADETIKQDKTTTSNYSACDDSRHFSDNSSTFKNNERIIIAIDDLLNEKCGELHSSPKKTSFISEASKGRKGKNSFILSDLEFENLPISKPKRIIKTPSLVRVKSRVILRPRLSYVALIRESIMASPENQLPLQGIYKYIAENYEYYRHCESGWKNSVRHNLSLNKCFFQLREKSQVQKKGSNWHYDSSYDQDFQNNNFTRRVRMKRSEKNSITTSNNNASTCLTLTTSLPRTYSHFYSHQHFNYSQHLISQSYQTSSNKDWSLAHTNRSSISAYVPSQRMPVGYIDPSASASHAYVANNYSYGMHPTTQASSQHYTCFP